MDMEKEVLLLNIDDILPNRFQPRIKFNEQALQELASSIKEHGVFQPIVVRRISDKYEIIAGERRYKASILAGKTTIPAIVTSLDDKNSAEIALIENVQRQDLTPIEEAISYKKILDMGYISQSELGEKLGKKQSTIANKLRLLNLNEDVQEALMENKISERHARSLLKLNIEKQTFMLNRIMNERLTVRKTDEEIEKMLGKEEIKEEEGEYKMNNDLLKEFNIPTEPIIEETEETGAQKMNQPINPFMSNGNLIENQEGMESSSSINQNLVNPGFMDVDKIQNEAVNIIKEPPAMADLNELLKPTPSVSPVEPVQEAKVEEVENESTQKSGRFFNMFNFNKEEENPNYVSDIESKEVNMDFGEPKKPTTSIFNFSTSAIDELKNIESNNKTEEITSIKESTPTQSIIEETEENGDQKVIQSINPFVNDNQNNVMDVQSMNSIEPPISSIESSPIANNENIIEFTKPIEPMSLNDEQEFTPITSYDDSMITNSKTISSTQAQPEIKISPMMPQNVIYDEDGEIEVKIPNKNENVAMTDFKTVINTIRDCAATIEKFGYIIDTEEIDFDNSYQVVFKINKQ